MSGRIGIFGQHATAYADAGMPAFPVNTRAKRPAVRGWQTASPGLTRAWARKRSLAAADGLGIVMGPSSGITEIDVDAAGEAWMAAAVQRFGETPIMIRTASGKSKLWYRHSGEGRHIRSIAGQPIDVLGSGFTVAPPSWRNDLGTGYQYLTGGLQDLERLPVIRSGSFDMASACSASVTEGGRNNSLWRYCMAQARFCDDFEALLDVAATWSSAFPDPLSAVEVARCARSAWKYQCEGRNFIGLIKPQLSEKDLSMDALIDRPEAFTLFRMLERWHGSKRSFAIAPTAMSKAGSPPWSRQRIENARDVLLDRRFLEEIAEPSRGRRKAGKYRLSSGEQKMPEIDDNHFTPLSPLGGEEIGPRVRMAGSRIGRGTKTLNAGKGN